MKIASGNPQGNLLPKAMLWPAECRQAPFFIMAIEWVKYIEPSLACCTALSGTILVMIKNTPANTKKILLLSVMSLAVFGILSAIPVDTTSGETGATATALGLPFHFYTSQASSVPNATDETHFHLELFIINLAIISGFVFALSYLIQQLNAKAVR